MAWHSLQQYKISVAATASTALQMAEIQTCYDTNNVKPVARINSVGCSAVFIFGNNAVAADATADGTTKKLAAGNTRIAEGSVETFALEQSDDYFSVISDDETDTGTIWVDIGYGE